MNKIFKRVMALLMALTMILSLAACGAPADDEDLFCSECGSKIGE